MQIFYSIDSRDGTIFHLSGHDGVVGADGDEDHVVDLREEEGGVVDVALQENLHRTIWISVNYFPDEHLRLKM